MLKLEGCTKNHQSAVGLPKNLASLIWQESKELFVKNG